MAVIESANARDHYFLLELERDYLVAIAHEKLQATDFKRRAVGVATTELYHLLEIVLLEWNVFGVFEVLVYGQSDEDPELFNALVGRVYKVMADLEDVLTFGHQVQFVELREYNTQKLPALVSVV